jgi:hypothetical protein
MMFSSGSLVASLHGLFGDAMYSREMNLSVNVVDYQVLGAREILAKLPEQGQRIISGLLRSYGEVARRKLSGEEDHSQLRE